MFRVLTKRYLANNIWLIEVEAPNVARACLPGQFVIVKLDQKAERVPLTICDYDRERQSITLVYQSIGSSTKRMEKEDENGYADVVGPLGQPSELCKMPREELEKENILFMAGGVGTAPVYPQIKWLKENGYKADVIVGARTKDLIILEEEMKEWAENLYFATDDGSYGFHGNVNDCLKDLINNQGKKYTKVVAIGPMIMMKFVSLTTKELGIPTIVSMNPIMVDGTGMCGACRLTVGDEIKFACVDGPEFDGHLINFDEAMNRQRMYKTRDGRKALREKEGETHHNKGGCGKPNPQNV